MVHYNFESIVPAELTEAFDPSDINAVNEMERRVNNFEKQEKKDANNTAKFIVGLFICVILGAILIDYFI